MYVYAAYWVDLMLFYVYVSRANHLELDNFSGGYPWRRLIFIFLHPFTDITVYFICMCARAPYACRGILRPKPQFSARVVSALNHGDFSRCPFCPWALSIRVALQLCRLWIFVFWTFVDFYNGFHFLERGRGREKLFWGVRTTPTCWYKDKSSVRNYAGLGTWQ